MTSKGSLLLHPVTSTLIPERQQLIDLLEKIGLIGAPLDEQSWMAGDAFLQLLTFMGCSPHIRLEPESDSDTDYCYISLHDSTAPKLLYSNHSRPCRCSSCGKPVVANWDEFDTNADAWQCRHCDKLHHRIETLRWRNDAGFSACFVEIHSIYPGEAQPVASLIKNLENLSSCEWRYFYLHL